MPRPAKNAAPEDAAASEDAGPTVLQYNSDGRIVPPPEFGGAGLDPAEEGTVGLFEHDPSRQPAPRQEIQDPEAAYATGKAG
jgi:hypothetical protein